MDYREIAPMASRIDSTDPLVNCWPTANKKILPLRQSSLFYSIIICASSCMTMCRCPCWGCRNCWPRCSWLSTSSCRQDGAGRKRFPRDTRTSWNDRWLGTCGTPKNKYDKSCLLTVVCFCLFWSMKRFWVRLSFHLQPSRASDYSKHTR